MDREKIRKHNLCFFDFWAKTYDWSILKPWLFYLQKKATGYVDINKKINVLDVGCGTGDTLRILSKNSRAKLYGIDLSENMLERARKKLGTRAVLNLGDADKLQFRNNFFDYVICTEAFHHFPEPNLTFKEMKRVLKKGGRLILTDVNFYSNFIHWLFKIIEPGHVKIYSEGEFRDFFVKNNFKIEKQQRIGLFAILAIGKK